MLLTCYCSADVSDLQLQTSEFDNLGFMLSCLQLESGARIQTILGHFYLRIISETVPANSNLNFSQASNRSEFTA